MSRVATASRRCVWRNPSSAWLTCHRARTGSAIAGMIALPGGRGWPAAASWNRVSHIAEGDGTARRRGARLQRPAVGARPQPALDLAHHLDKAGVLFQPLQILQPPARFSTISATII